MKKLLRYLKDWVERHINCRINLFHRIGGEGVITRSYTICFPFGKTFMIDSGMEQFRPEGEYDITRVSVGGESKPINKQHLQGFNVYKDGKLLFYLRKSGK